MKDLIGQAMYDYFHNNQPDRLWVHNTYGPREEMLVPIYFRGEESMPDLEWTTIEACKGTVLDIGAGAGSHSLALQKRGMDVTALDASALAVEVMKARGLKNVLLDNALTFNQGKYDTLLMLMNGIGLVGNLNGLRQFLHHVLQLLNPGGQLLFDTSNVAYLYEDDDIQNREPYYGEIKYQYEYRKKKTNWFTWLYVDQKTLSNVANEEGWSMEVLFEDDEDQYLARLTRK